MKHIFILLITITTAIQMQAQNIWKDYVIGRPMAGHFEAKKTTAEEWGINYQAIFAGCVLTDEVNKQHQEYKKGNEEYFERLASTFGKDWQRHFNLDVQKKLNLSSKDTGVWIEPVMGKPYMPHFDATRIVAKKWGINYEVKFLGCVVDDEKTAEMEKIMSESNAYTNRLTARFGEKWEEEFNREVKLETAKMTAPIIPIPDDATKAKDIWVDYVIGKPNMSYFDAKKAIAKEWGIPYATNFMDCRRTAHLVNKRKKANAQNEKLFVKLAKRYGEDWKEHFDREVQKKIALTRLERVKEKEKAAEKKD